MIPKNKKEHKGLRKKFEITAQGSLGLLAYGDIGLRAWREFKQKTLYNNHK